MRRALHLEQLHLLGHSWGGWLAIEYLLTHPSRVLSLEETERYLQVFAEFLTHVEAGHARCEGDRG